MRMRTSSSSGRRTVFHSPLATKNSSTVTVRVPAGEARSTTAPTVISTGGVSAECAATHFFPTRVTWQTSPSFFRQKPSACRQKKVWL
jgi:hypothetical protein